MLNKFNKIRSSREEGFALTELLTVVIIIGVIAAIALPIFIKQQREALRTDLKNDVRTLITSIQTMLVKHPGAVGGQNRNDNFVGSDAWDKIHQEAVALSGTYGAEGAKNFIICQSWEPKTGIIYEGFESGINGYAVVGYFRPSGDEPLWVYGFDGKTGKYSTGTITEIKTGIIPAPVPNTGGRW